MAKEDPLRAAHQHRAVAVNWREAVLSPDMPTAPSVSPSVKPAFPSRPPSACTVGTLIPHSFDVLALLLLGGLAAYLRLGDLYLIWPQLQGGLCDDPAYHQRRRDPAIALPPDLTYVVAVLAPIFLVILLELALVFALRRNLVRARESKLLFFSKRCVKMTLVFLMGLCLTSVITDVLRLLVSRPRPYFLADNAFGFGYERYCSTKQDESIGALERDARLSFPSHRCSMVAFSGAVVAVYAELVLRRVRRVYAGGLRSVFLLAATMPALLVASQAFDSRSNHWQDIVVGLLLGALLGVYTVLVLARDLDVQADAMSAIPLREASTSHHLPRLRIPSVPPSMVSSTEVVNGIHTNMTAHTNDDIF